LIYKINSIFQKYLFKQNKISNSIINNKIISNRIHYLNNLIILYLKQLKINNRILVYLVIYLKIYKILKKNYNNKEFLIIVSNNKILIIKIHKIFCKLVKIICFHKIMKFLNYHKIRSNNKALILFLIAMFSYKINNLPYFHKILILIKIHFSHNKIINEYILI
jgi:hypothetical protein